MKRAFRLKLKVIGLGLGFLLAAPAVQAANQCELLFGTPEVSETEFIVMRFDTGTGRSSLMEARLATRRSVIIEAHEGAHTFILQPRYGNEAKYDRHSVFRYLGEPFLMKAVTRDPNDVDKRVQEEWVNVIASRQVESRGRGYSALVRTEYVGRRSNGDLVLVLNFVE